MIKRLAGLEEAVFNQGKSNEVFDEIRDRIVTNEAVRKVDNMKLIDRMDNVEKAMSN